MGYVNTPNTPKPTQKHPFSWPELESRQNELQSRQFGPQLGKMFYKWAKLFLKWANFFNSCSNQCGGIFIFFGRVGVLIEMDWNCVFKILNEFKLQVTQKENVIRWGMLFAKQWVSKHTLYEYKFWNLWPIPSPLRLNMITHFSRSRRVWCRASWRFQELTNTRYIGTTVSLITWSAKFNCWNVTLHFFWIMIKKKLSTKMHFFSASILG